MSQMQSTLLRVSLKAVAMAFALQTVALYATPCPDSHCTAWNMEQRKKDKLIAACTASGKPSAIVPHEDDYCSCPCSCYGTGAQVTTPDGEAFVEELQKGQAIKTLAGQVAIQQVLTSPVTDHSAVLVTLDNGKRMTLSKNHALVSADHLIVHAEGLKAGSKLLGANDEVVTVSSVTPTKYSGTFYNVALSGNQADGADRIVISEGVQSGDWFVQAYRDQFDANVDVRSVIQQVHAAKH